MSTIITQDDIKHLEKISMIQLSNEERNTFTPQLTSILDYVEKLGEVDTKDVQETTQVTGITNVLREDIVVPTFTQEQALSNAPEQERGYFKIKGSLKNISADA
jgi:aspartyl-tRNA(Asn)/glutamyl-tRNA(Gln) amidotransferase subunit C